MPRASVSEQEAAVDDTMVQFGSCGLDGALEMEARGQLALLQSQDFIEGLSAFFGKRAPQFAGK